MHRSDLFESLEPRTLLSRAVGIDIADYQHPGGAAITWNSVASAGVQYCWVKATEGTGYLNSYFAGDMNGGTAAGVVMGAYHYARYDLDSAAAEANYFLSKAGAYVAAGYLRPMLDVEQATSLTKSQVSTWVNTWCNAVYQATGVKPVVYTYVSYAQSYLDSTVTQWPLSMASYPGGTNGQTGNPTTTPWSTWANWQYTSTGGVAGIASTNVDHDVANGDMTSFVIPQMVAGSSQFTTGEVVYVNAPSGLKAYSSYQSNGTYVVEPNGASGVIKGGPVYINGSLRWPILYSGSSSTTWSAGSDLVADLPTVTSFAGSPNPVTAGANVTLAASATDPASTVSSVLFYRESDGMAGLQSGRGGDMLLGYGSNNGSGAWSIGASTAGLSGAVTYYAVATNAAGTSSAPASTSVAVRAVTPPTLAGAVINGDDPNGLFTAAGQGTNGKQRSMVEDIVYTFNEPVTIPNANAAFTVLVAGPAGGTVPSTLFAQAVAGSNGTQWAVSLTGKAEGTLASIANGEYSIQINPPGVFAAADGTTAMAAGTGRTDTFFRLFGDIDGNESVSTLDYGRFKQALAGAYNPAFDYDGSGTISTLDYGRFKQDMPISYFNDGFVTTI
jgi:GH25 family lysozyme M1 (1,4-beta-N-acetylmuramidase)